MRKIMTASLSMILCALCFSGSVITFAETNESAVLIDSDAFTYSRKEGQAISELTLKNDEFHDIYVVSGVICDDNGEPVEYYLDSSNVPITEGGESGLWNAGEAETLLGRELVIGDVISCSEFFAQEMMPPNLFIESIIDEYKENPEAYFEEYGYIPYVEYLGAGTELFGDDFKYVVCEMSAGSYGAMESLENRRSWYEQMNLAIDIDYGDANADGNLTIMDVINVNRNIMIGAPLTAYGTLAADVDKNGEVDAVDSLNMLKGVVGLVDLKELG